jgi:hypothetical protein
MRIATLILAGLVGLVSASPAWAGNILVYQDVTHSGDCVPGGIALTSHTATTVTSATAFNTAMSSGTTWDLVIVGEQSGTIYSTISSTLAAYVAGGGRVIGASWTNSGFEGLMQASVSSTNPTSITTTSHQIFANLGSSIGIATASTIGWGTDARAYNPTGSATGLGTCASAYGVILGNSGHTLFNAPLFDSYSTVTQAQQFIANEINFLLPHGTLTGRVLYDRYVVDASGIGNTSQPSVPLAGMRVEARLASNALAGAAVTDEQGNFSLVAYGLTGSLVVCAQNSATTLRAVAAGAPLYATFATSVAFNADQNVGTYTITEGLDPGGVARAPINAARTIKQAYDWAHARSTDTIPFIEVLYDNSSAPTSYTAKAGATPATMRISGSSSNPDGWDVDVIRKTYARHILGSIAADPGIAPNTTFDALTAPENAFAEGFGYAFAALMSGSRYYVDGTSSSTAIVIDLESPTGIQSPKTGACAAWVAPALYDLMDPANEPWDTVDGTASGGTAPLAEQVFTVVDSLSAPVTASTFYSAWLSKGYDAPGISRDFVHHGLLPDDSDEPNDTPDTATQIDQFGFVLNNLTLNIANDDWYAFTLPEATGSMTVVVSYNRVTYGSVTLLVEITSSSGSVIATGTAADTTSPYKAVTGALPAGKYLLHVALATGGPLPIYSVQAYSKLEFRSDKFPEWTLGRPYDVHVNIVGGIPPYGLTIPSTYQGPNGLTLHGDTGIVDGTPTGPTEGIPVGGSKEYSFLLNAVDGASPPNTASQLITFVLNDRMRSRFADYTAFARGTAIDRAWKPSGGTTPYTVTLDDGSLPNGLSIVDGDRLAFRGTPDTAGASQFKMTTTDFAGSSASTLATAVVCTPTGPNSIAAGPTACGWYFDALMGSNVSLVLATDKKQPIRTAYHMVLLDVDGMTPLLADAKVGKGKITLSKFTTPSTGRFFCVLAADDAGPATSLVATAKITPPKKGRGDSGFVPFGGAATLEVPVPALAGATLSFLAKPDKSGLQLSVLRLVDPSGKTVDLPAGTVKSKKGSVAFKFVLPTTGDWTVVLGALAGPSGQFVWSYGLKQPKGVSYTAE